MRNPKATSRRLPLEAQASEGVVYNLAYRDALANAQTIMFCGYVSLDTDEETTADLTEKPWNDVREASYVGVIPSSEGDGKAVTAYFNYTATDPGSGLVFKWSEYVPFNAEAGKALLDRLPAKVRETTAEAIQQAAASQRGYADRLIKQAEGVRAQAALIDNLVEAFASTSPR